MVAHEAKLYDQIVILSQRLDAEIPAATLFEYSGLEGLCAVVAGYPTRLDLGRLGRQASYSQYAVKRDGLGSCTSRGPSLIPIYEPYVHP